jgi:hypothetical protein
MAETAIVHCAARLSVGVYKPLTDGERYDLIFDLGSRLLRVQCKWLLDVAKSSSSGAGRAAGPAADSFTARINETSSMPLRPIAQNSIGAFSPGRGVGGT